MRRRPIVGPLAVCLLLVAGASASGSTSTAARAKTSWKVIGAVLPANAATADNQDVSINSVSCASAGNCSAVGVYQDTTDRQDGLLLTEKAGKWAAGVEITEFRRSRSPAAG